MRKQLLYLQSSQQSPLPNFPRGKSWLVCQYAVQLGTKQSPEFTCAAVFRRPVAFNGSSYAFIFHTVHNALSTEQGLVYTLEHF